MQSEFFIADRGQAASLGMIGMRLRASRGRIMFAIPLEIAAHGSRARNVEEQDTFVTAKHRQTMGCK